MRYLDPKKDLTFKKAFDFIAEREYQAKLDTAKNLELFGVLTLEQIAQATGLSVKAIATL